MLSNRLHAVARSLFLFYSLSSISRRDTHSMMHMSEEKLAQSTEEEGAAAAGNAAVVAFVPGGIEKWSPSRWLSLFFFASPARYAPSASWGSKRLGQLEAGIVRGQQ